MKDQDIKALSELSLLMKANFILKYLKDDFYCDIKKEYYIQSLDEKTLDFIENEKLKEILKNELKKTIFYILSHDNLTFFVINCEIGTKFMLFDISDIKNFYCFFDEIDFYNISQNMLFKFMFIYSKFHNTNFKYVVQFIEQELKENN